MELLDVFKVLNFKRTYWLKKKLTGGATSRKDSRGMLIYGKKES